MLFVLINFIQSGWLSWQVAHKSSLMKKLTLIVCQPSIECPAVTEVQDID